MNVEHQDLIILHCKILLTKSKSEFVTDSLLIFKGGPLGPSSLKNDYKNIL